MSDGGQYIIHDGNEANIQPHAQVSVADVLAEIGRRRQAK